MKPSLPFLSRVLSGLGLLLAVLANEAADVARAGEDEPARRIREQTELMQRQVDYHLARARAAASARVPGVRTEVAASLDRLARTLRTIHAARGLTIACAVDEAPCFRGERQDFDEMAGNLLDNACKWARREVRVSARATDPGRLAVVVDDDGPGLPPARRAEVFDRGRRLDEAVAGSGLGLTIAAELAELYDGGIELADSPLGGLRAVLTLPAAS